MKRSIKYFDWKQKKLGNHPLHKKNIRKSMSLLFIMVFSLTMGVLKPSYANSDYSFSVVPGTQILEIDHCNLQLWKETINHTSSPLDWFPGNSNQTGAQSKKTVRILAFGECDTYTLFLMIYSAYDIDYFELSDYGYDSNYLRLNFAHRYYNFWAYDLAIDYFMMPPLEDNSYESSEMYKILSHPSDFSTLIDDYNNFSETVNNDPLMQSLNISIPEFDGDYFLQYLIFNELATALPSNVYLNELIDALGCENASVQESSLILNCKGISNYQLEISYNEQGLMDTFKVKTEDGTLIYKITSWYPKYVVYTIFGIIIAGIIGLSAVFFYLSRKKIKFFKEN